MKRVLSLGLMPLANNLNPNAKTESTKYPLEVNRVINAIIVSYHMLLIQKNVQKLFIFIFHF